MFMQKSEIKALITLTAMLNHISSIDHGHKIITIVRNFEIFHFLKSANEKI
jgi:hypothetical protein